ncbi:hypothetical protein AHAS_Ahas12G0264900 [Arachis hypogaea]
MASIRVVALCLVSFQFLVCVIEGIPITITNNCPYTVWPGSQANQGSPQLSKTGFELSSQKSDSVDVPAKWSGKFWARTGCSNNNGMFSCATADCGNHVECSGAGEATPASLMEFTVDTNGDHDTYDVSNVDGFNIPSSITPQGGTGTCKVASCPANINAACPNDLQFKSSDGSVVGCKSACVAYVGQGAQITFTNNCPYTVWPGTQSGATSPQLSSTGFELASGASNTLELPSGWSGKFWARTGCSNNNGVFSCTTADCGNHVECGGAGEATPASLIEITTGNNNGAQDFYDVSNVDGFNVPSSMSPQGGSGACGTASCPVNINAACPAELQFKGSDKSVVGCKSACVIFNTPEYCCNGDHNTPQTCPPTNYSQFFSQQCPNAYSYAYDDKRGTFTCSGNPSYVLKFCP